MAATKEKSQVDQQCKQGSSPLPTKFTNTLQEMIDSTSTPLLPRHDSKAEYERRQDSGFAEVSSLLLSQSSELAYDSKVNTHDYSLSQFPNSLPDPSEKCITPSVQSGDQHKHRLQQMQSYYDKLNQASLLEKRIGRRIGEEFVDIVSELTKLQIPAVSRIFSLLGNGDLLRCVRVSESWHSALHQDFKTKNRLNSLVEKENTSPKKKENGGSHAASSGTPLTSIQLNTNVSPQSSCTSSPEDWVPENVKFRRFAKAAQKLKAGQQFVRCARCSGPAKLYPEARQAICTSSECKYDYCTLCELEFHGAKDCLTRPKKKTREKPINSKESKKYLKRL